MKDKTGQRIYNKSKTIPIIKQKVSLSYFETKATCLLCSIQQNSYQILIHFGMGFKRIIAYIIKTVIVCFSNTSKTLLHFISFIKYPLI